MSLLLLGLGVVAAAGELSASDPVTVVGGLMAAALTALTGVQTAQMSGLRHDFQTYRTDQDARMKKLEGRIELLEGEAPAPPRRRKVTSSQTTTRGKRPQKAQPEG